jgi:t-SNARE complex subunit (syntaxin)
MNLREENELKTIDQLNWEVLALKDTMEVLNEIVVEQQPMIDRIEDVIITPKQDIQRVREEIDTADHYSSHQQAILYYTFGLAASMGAAILLLVLL